MHSLLYSLLYQELAKGTLHNLQAAAAKVPALTSPHSCTNSGKENSDGAASPAASPTASTLNLLSQSLPPPPAAAYSHQRVSPGHFWVQPTRSPLQPHQAASAMASPLAGPATRCGRDSQAQPGPGTAAAPAATPLSQQASRAESCQSGASSALLDNLNVALRALGECNQSECNGRVVVCLSAGWLRGEPCRSGAAFCAVFPNLPCG